MSLRIPNQSIDPGNDRVVLDLDGRETTMGQQDWQQFVACVLTADKQVRRVFDRAGRLLGPVPPA